jgi:SAM-dependent methyltransferase
VLGEDVMERLGTGQARLAGAWLPRGGRVLELGCSTGYLTRHVAGGADTAIGLDLNRRALAGARRRHPRAPLVCGEAGALPFATASLDAVVMLEVIEHAPSDAAAVREVARVLRPGGTLILSTPNAGLFAWLDPYNLRRRLQRRFPRLARGAARLARFETAQLTEGLEWHRHYALVQLTALLEPHFAVRRVHRGGLLLYPLVAAAISVASRLTRNRAVIASLHRLLAWDFRLRFGRLSYNLLLLAERRG